VLQLAPNSFVTKFFCDSTKLFCDGAKLFGDGPQIIFVTVPNYFMTEATGDRWSQNIWRKKDK